VLAAIGRAPDICDNCAQMLLGNAFKPPAPGAIVADLPRFATATAATAIHITAAPVAIEVNQARADIGRAGMRIKRMAERSRA
jgi:hypothetical protein